ncbi:MAG TPA: aminotransferase class V-fold PLP-dependent enzyme [Gemmataceae bacterium]|nr:aminotransferase class V-fold PLP-dependent enzyme [Gemmataceae bacterium]
MSDAFWTEARAQMLLDPEVTNLNTGSFGPLPRVVFDRATELRRRLAEEPMDFFVRRVPPLLWSAREQLAGFLGGDPRRLVFAANVTASINIVAAALRLAEPGEILLTDHEYGAMRWCWERAAQRQGLSLRTFALPILPRTPGEIVDAARAAFTDRTRLFFFSHILSPTGLVLPARELCAEARQRGILTVIDGAHAPAMIPLDLTSLGCDFYGGNGHKWLLAPSGAGFLYFGNGSEERVQPLQVSWGWHHDRRRADERDDFGSTPRLRAFEFEGSRDICPWLTVPTAINFQEGLGWERIRTRVLGLTGYLRERLAGLPGLSLATPAEPALHGAMTAFRLPDNLDPIALRRGLWQQYHIEAPIVERSEAFVGRSVAGLPPQAFPWRYLIRVSTWWYNTEQEIERLTAALTVLLPECRTE